MFFKNKRCLITGCCGTVGRELIGQLLTMLEAPSEVIGLDNDESGVFFLAQDWRADKRLKLFVSDLSDINDLEDKMRGIDIVFHCAALKHVILCEQSPSRAVAVNILGVQNVILAAQRCNVAKAIFTSSDKAVNPTNVMGTSKLMGERLFTAANTKVDGSSSTIFASTRFGNVLGSNGSVFPIFERQIKQGGPLTLTDARMTRFVMSISEAVNLVLKSAEIAKGGEILVTKMPVLKIKDLAAAMIAEFSPSNKEIPITEIGAKPGEKLYEELMSDEETGRAIELNDFFAVLPAFRELYAHQVYDDLGVVSQTVTNPYNSAQEPSLSVPEVASLLRKYGLINAPDVN